MKSSINVQHYSISAKQIYVVEEHHHVLLPWAEFRNKSGKPFTSLTLDHHTDVLPSGKFSNVQCSFDFTNEKNLLEDISMLRHDEHLDWAVKSGTIERAIVITHENFTPTANSQIQIICDSSWPAPQEMLDSSDETREMASKVLESEFLTKQLSSADIPYDATLVLDIDLDYFLTAEALKPKQTDVFLSLVKRSPIITISLERDWVKILRLKGETITSENILCSLLELIRKA